jgi:hypothetical protein
MSEENKKTLVDKHELKEDKEKMIRKLILSMEGPIVNPGLYTETLKVNFEVKGDKVCH